MLQGILTLRVRLLLLKRKGMDLFFRLKIMEKDLKKVELLVKVLLVCLECEKGLFQ